MDRVVEKPCLELVKLANFDSLEQNEWQWLAHVVEKTCLEHANLVNEPP